jgi:hypothetical protein
MPDDAAPLLTIHDQDYSLSEGELTIRVDDQQFDWWDFVHRYRAPRGGTAAP